ncbi:hypothetical protein D7X30_35010 [Corallococcus sp. AB011P]|uniref:DUF6119 family protein n=1 Tax=unclassified Corallococcus TaxID=2685029 RepID=UPI000EA2E9BF|nr:MULTISPECIES: DUF6119 family protein [unclassified Corallococcus]RKG52033.1 hypothetical protein D7X30_35010 [Corallococcus sp. AB011P]RKH90555.1 hypothetical protein D7Y21_06375 [Corallococcus sp. AB045]
MKLNLTLFREEIDSFEGCLRGTAGNRAYQPSKSTKKLLDADHKIYFVKTEPRPPKWLKFIESYVSTKETEHLSNHTASALVLLKVTTHEGPRFFGMSAGFGHLFINKDNIELNFGLITALNSVDPTKLRTIDSKKLGVQTLQKREASNLETKLGEFGFEFDSEILHIVSGTCIDETLGARIGGSDSLNLHTKLDFEELPAKCATLFKRYRSDSYKQAFSFIDHVKLEKSSRIKQQLDDQMLDVLNKRRSAPHVSVAYPDQIDYNECVSYLISGKGGSSIVDEITLQRIYDYIGKETLTIDDLKKIKIFGLSDLDRNSRRTEIEPLYAYLTHEAKLGDRRYILSNRRWYEVDRDYLEKLDRDLKEYVRFSSTPILPPWRLSQNKKGVWVHDEGDYNKACGADKNFLLLDRKLYSFGTGHGGSRVEVADLFHRPSSKLLCVKKLSSSATLNHLLAQATVSAELFSDMEQYRERFLASVATHWGIAKPAQDFIRTLKFVYAIGTQETVPLLDLLPVFSKVMLMKHIRLLQRARFDVELAQVLMTNDQAQPATAPPAPKQATAKVLRRRVRS